MAEVFEIFIHRYHPEINTHTNLLNFEHTARDSDVAFKWVMFGIFVYLVTTFNAAFESKHYYCPYVDDFIDSRINGTTFHPVPRFAIWKFWSQKIAFTVILIWTLFPVISVNLVNCIVSKNA